MAIREDKHVVIIGGGLAGLTAAYRLCKLAEQAEVSLEITLLEKSTRLGGVIESAEVDGCALEFGPDSVITDKPAGIELFKELGLGDDVIPTMAEHAGSFIAQGDKLVPVPEGLHLMAPANLFSFATTNLLSPLAKIRVLKDLVTPKRTDGADESLADFVRRRLGQEMLDRIAQPMVGGIYTADPEKLSLRATLPRFQEMETRYGSVIRGAMAARNTNDSARKARGPRYDLFVSIQSGLGQVIDALAEAIAEKVHIRTETPVAGIQKTESGWEVHVDDEPIAADSLCVATPAFAAAKLVSNLDPVLAEQLSGIEYASVATINFLLRRDQVPNTLTGFGFVVPAIERKLTLAATFCTLKYDGRTAPGSFVVRAFAGGALREDVLGLTDEELAPRIWDEIRSWTDINGEPSKFIVSRYDKAMPQYHVGHIERIDTIDARVKKHACFELAGAAYHGTGIPDCIQNASDAASALFNELRA